MMLTLFKANRHRFAFSSLYVAMVSFTPSESTSFRTAIRARVR